MKPINLDKFPDNTAIIRYKENGVIGDWAIGADPKKDNEETMRDHLRKWRPNAEFIDCAIK